MSENRNATITPGRREVALRLAAALISNPNVLESTGVDSAAIRAIAILNAVEKRLNLPTTKARPAGTPED